MITEDISKVLQDIGFQLTDCGDHWRSSALFRRGDNPTAIKIYKNSGVWFDYTVDSKPQPFDKLLRFFIPDKQKRQALIGSASDNDEFYEPKIQLQMEKVYPESDLERLLPNYNFYFKKGYSEDTLKFYKAGVAHSGKMYRRTVFPIYNADHRIIGFSGRKVSDEVAEVPKWKHIGKKKTWIYPAFIPHKVSIDDIIKDKKEVYLVESIGDSLALFETGAKNNLVRFGLDCSPAIINYLSSFDIQRIVLVPNNDTDASKNHGYNAVIKSLRTLSSYFDFSILEIRKPPVGHNDLSAAFEKKVDLVKWRNEPNENWLEEAQQHALSNKSQFQDKDLDFLRQVKYYART